MVFIRPPKLTLYHHFRSLQPRHHNSLYLKNQIPLALSHQTYCLSHH